MGLGVGGLDDVTATQAVAAGTGAQCRTGTRVLGMLSSELGCDGVLVSDALDTHAIAHGVGRRPGAVAALAAGVDLLCAGNPSFPARYDDEAGHREVRDAVVAAPADDTLPAPRAEDTARRVAELAHHAATAPPSTRVHPGVGFGVARRVIEVVDDVRGRRGAHVLDLTAPWLAAARGRGQCRRPPGAVAVHVGPQRSDWVPEPPSITLRGAGRGHAEAMRGSV